MGTNERCQRYFLLLSVLILLGSCTTAASLRPQTPVAFRGGYHFRQPYEKVFEAALKSLKELAFVVQERNQNTGYIIAERIPGWLDWGWGEVVGIYLVHDGPAATRVLIVTRKRWIGDALARDWSLDVYRNMSLELDWIKPESSEGEKPKARIGNPGER